MLENNRLGLLSSRRRFLSLVAKEELAWLWALAALLSSLQLLAVGRQHSVLLLKELLFPRALLSASECQSGIVELIIYLNTGNDDFHL